MHELSMAEAIVETVLDVAKKNDAQEVVEVTIEVGKLTMLNPEQLKFLLGVLIEDTLLEDAEIIIEEVPVEIKCRNCEFTGLANTDGSDHYLAIVLCPKCDERNVEILKSEVSNVSVASLVADALKKCF